MNTIIQAKVLNRQVSIIGTPFVLCNNKDFKIQFEFDSDWDDYPIKTARFVVSVGGVTSNTDIVFSGNEVNVPIMQGIDSFQVGVFAGDIIASTSTSIRCKKSIVCGLPSPLPPNPDIYNKIIAEIEKTKGASAFIRFSEHPDGRDFTEEWHEGQRYIGFATSLVEPTTPEEFEWNYITSGPKGDKGDPGEKGEKGDPGDAGEAARALVDDLKTELESGLTKPMYAYTADNVSGIVMPENGGTGHTNLSELSVGHASRADKASSATRADVADEARDAERAYDAETAHRIFSVQINPASGSSPIAILGQTGPDGYSRDISTLPSLYVNHLTNALCFPNFDGLATKAALATKASHDESGYKLHGYEVIWEGEHPLGTTPSTVSSIIGTDILNKNLIFEVTCTLMGVTWSLFTHVIKLKISDEEYTNSEGFVLFRTSFKPMPTVQLWKKDVFGQPSHCEITLAYEIDDLYLDFFACFPKGGKSQFNRCLVCRSEIDESNVNAAVTYTLTKVLACSCYD